MLLRRAKARFESAKMQYSKISDDDAYLDMCCLDYCQMFVGRAFALPESFFIIFFFRGQSYRAAQLLVWIQ